MFPPGPVERHQDVLDQLVDSSGKLKTVNELDPQNNYIDTDKIAKFLGEFDRTFMDRSKPQGPDYLIIDNFVDTFSNLEKADLINALTETYILTSHLCDVEEDSAHARCDNLTWIQNLISHGDKTPGLREIAYAMT